MTRRHHWPPYLSPLWLAVYAAGLGAWLALYALGGWTLVAVVAGVGIYAIARIGWWIHTWSERVAERAPRRWRGEDEP